jgi:hypothetical protein
MVTEADKTLFLSMEQFTVVGVDVSSRLQFSYYGPFRDFAVSFQGPNLEVSRKIVSRFDAEGKETLVGFFQEIHHNWRGWKGEMYWESLEGDMSLSCSHDGVGRVRLRIILRVDPMNGWKAEMDLKLEPGQLDSLANHAKVFFEKLESLK